MQVKDKIIKNWTQLIYYQMKKRMGRKKKNNLSARNVREKCLNGLKIFKLKKNHKLIVVNLCS